MAITRTNENTLTNLIPDASIALDVVAREIVGFIPSVTRDPSADRIAVGQNLRVPQTPANSAGRDIVPAMALPTVAAQTIGYETVTLTQARAFPFSWSSEDRYAIDQGAGALTINQQQIAQAFRAAIGEIETELATIAGKYASRNAAVADSTVFKTNLADLANQKKILDDNGAPSSDRHFIMSTTCGAAMRTLTQLSQANTSADTQLLRQGVLGDIYGFQVRESSKTVSPAIGTTSNAVLASTATTVGQTSFTLKAAGSGTIVVGDVVTIGVSGDTNRYLVISSTATSSVSGAVFTIAAPGLRVAQGAAEHAVAVVAKGERNIALARPAILLATRLPMNDASGGILLDSQTITDPISGLSFELSAWGGYRMVTYEVGILWGTKVLRPDFISQLQGAA
jgi:hypothetical protein